MTAQFLPRERRTRGRVRCALCGNLVQPYATWTVRGEHYCRRHWADASDTFRIRERQQQEVDR